MTPIKPHNYKALFSRRDAVWNVTVKTSQLELDLCIQSDGN